jgi:hypothetical protein
MLRGVPVRMFASRCARTTSSSGIVASRVRSATGLSVRFQSAALGTPRRIQSRLRRWRSRARRAASSCCSRRRRRGSAGSRRTGSYRARVAPFNVSYRYVESELVYLLTDSKARALVYPAEFAPRVAAIRDRLPDLQVLIQVADESGNALLDGAVDYETILTPPEPAGGMPTPSGDDLYLLYTGGTTGMPKGVLWRQHDIFLSSMGGRPWGADEFTAPYAELAEKARAAAGAMSILVIPPFMHGHAA